jgi:hypothetical protein
MARPRLSDDDKPVIVPIKIRLYTGRDDDLIDFFKRIPDRLRAGSVKNSLRHGGLLAVVDDLPSDADVEAALDALLG